MGLYFAVFSAVFFVACLKMSVNRDKYLCGYVILLYIVLTVMLCLRYGQGADYFRYEYIFNGAKSLSRIRQIYHGEPLFLFLCFVFNQIGEFQFFLAVVAIAEMAMIWRFIRRNSANNAVSVMIMMTVLYTNYFCSTLRQGITMSIFLCFGLELAEKRRWIKYFILCFILTMLHTVSVIYFFVPLVLKFKVSSIVLSIPLCAVFSTVILTRIAAGFLPHYDIGIRIISAAERIFSLFMVYIIYSSVREKYKYKWLMKLYSFGTALYFMFLPFSLVASRVTVCFKLIEIVLVPCLMKEHSRYRTIFICYFFISSVLMFSNSLYAEVKGGHYIDSINFMNYPYVSVFNPEEIYNYRKLLRGLE